MLLKDLNRDKSPETSKPLNDDLHGPEHKQLSDKLEIATPAVCTAYWRRGHGLALPRRWTMDGVGIEFSVASSGRDRYGKCGFGGVEVVSVLGFYDCPAGVELWVGFCTVDEGAAKSLVRWKTSARFEWFRMGISKGQEWNIQSRAWIPFWKVRVQIDVHIYLLP